VIVKTGHHAVAADFVEEVLGGQVGVVSDGLDAYVDMLLVVAIGTALGERDMAGSFGIPDPAFSGIEIGDVQAAVDLFGPAGVTITSITADPLSATSMSVAVQWAYAQVTG